MAAHTTDWHFQLWRTTKAPESRKHWLSSEERFLDVFDIGTFWSTNVETHFTPDQSFTCRTGARPEYPWILKMGLKRRFRNGSKNFTFLAPVQVGGGDGGVVLMNSHS